MKLLIDYIRFELKRFFINKRLALVFFIGPLIASAVFALITFQTPSDIKVGLIVKHDNSISQSLAESIKADKTLLVSDLPNETEALQQFKTGKIKSYVVVDVTDGQGSVNVIADPRYPEVEAMVQQHIITATKDIIALNSVQNLTKSIAANVQNSTGSSSLTQPINIQSEPIKLSTSEYLPRTTKNFDRYASGMIALVIVLIFLLKAATSLAQDRESGVLERLFSTPASRRKLMLGKIIANVIIGLISVIAIVLMLHFVFGAIIGSWALVMLIAFLTAVVSVTMGVFISTIIKDLTATIQFAFYTFFVMVLTSEFLFARENIYKYFKWITALNPLTYAISALRKVNLFNWGLHEIWLELVVLAVFAVVFTVSAIVLIERESK
jgi:ABC-2 type transport system permease protein